MDTLWPMEPSVGRAWTEAKRASVPDESLIDPLARLLDPGFTEVLWEYEHSRTEPEIPGSLHAKQESVLESEARHRWLFWGNQVGKTTIGAVDVVLLALGRHPVQTWEPPVTQWASALTWELWEKILLPELLTWIPADRIVKAPEPHVHSTNRDILVRADNGKVSRITGKAAQQGAAMYQSARVHQVWLDEEHPESVWNEMQPRLLRHGGRTVATMTPLKGFTWVYHRIYEPWSKGQADENTFCSHAGLRDNPAIGPAEIAALSESLKHNPAQLMARLEGRFVRPEGLALKIDPERHFVAMDDDEARTLVAMGEVFGGIDFGEWRFAFTLWAVDRDGRVHQIAELFSQREDSEHRAQAIHDIAEHYGCPERIRIWGDAANPSDIRELNNNFRRIESKHRVVAVEMRNKERVTSVTRLNDLLGRDALFFRKGAMSGTTWLMGMNASHAGVPIEGSRLAWEMNNWQYPKPVEGKSQGQDPDDNTADGADAVASMRYGIMSWWSAAPDEPEPPIKREPGYDSTVDELVQQIKRSQQRKRNAFS